MTDVHGVCDTTFKEVRDVLAANLDAGEDLGASVAITIDGAPVVDLWGGWRDADRTQPWERGHDRQRLVDHQDDDEPRARSCWPIGASSTSTDRWPTTGPSSRPTARRPSRCAT